MGWRCRAVAATALAMLAAPVAAQQPERLPILVPLLTGFVALEGASQKNGALLAVGEAGGALKPEVLDTASTPEAAVTAWERSLGAGTPPAVVGPILGTQMLALLPLAQKRKVPLLTISDTARLGRDGQSLLLPLLP